ncbi:MAG: CHRD domain-containing protein [Tunicatimonas sp.]
MINFTHNRILLFTLLLGAGLFGLTSCDEDTEFTPAVQEDPSTGYRFTARNNSMVDGYIKFTKVSESTTEVLISVGGTEQGNTHPAQLRNQSAAETGAVVTELEPVNGATGRSTTTINQAYEQLLDFDGHVTIQLSGSDPTIVSESDIGANELTGTSKEYRLLQRDGSGVTGIILMEQRKNGSTLATIQLDSLDKLADGTNYAAGIFNNNTSEGGDIGIRLEDVSGTTGMSETHIETIGDSPVNYGALVGTDDAAGFDGYVSIFQGTDVQGPLLVQNNIGGNELTGASTTYTLSEKDVEGISGTAKFEKRANGETLVTISLEGTPEGGVHPAHIHANTAAQGGGIVVTFNPVNGTTGTSVTNVTATDGEEGAAITYDELVGTDDTPGYDGYINVHLGPGAQLETIVAQGDIGQNVFTGEEIVYQLDSIAVPSIKGTATFQERSNGSALVTIQLQNTPADGTHPAHIHANTAAEGGAIAISLNPVNGATGLSQTEVSAYDDGTEVSYADLLDYDGYINVHLSAADLGTIVAQGDIGSNVLTGESVVYALNAVADSGVNVSGTATFAERKDGTTLVTVVVTGTPAGGNHPTHIHYNSAEEGGAIAVSLTNVDGDTGLSKTSVMALDNNIEVTYDELIAFDGYINVHLSPEDLATIVSQGDIGANVAE